MIFAKIFIYSGCLILLLSGISFFRSKDFYVMLQPLKICNFYALNLILVGFLIENFSFANLAKVFLIIIANLIITHLLCDFLADSAYKKGLTPDADFVKK